MEKKKWFTKMECFVFNKFPYFSILHSPVNLYYTKKRNNYSLFTFSYSLNPMASRTNKRGIAQKKAQLQKQAKRTKGIKKFTYPKRKLDIDEAKEFGVIGVFKNPRGNEYNRFLRGRKVCRETGLRVDPDGYRVIRTPSGGTDIVVAPMSGRIRTKIMKRGKSSF